MHNSDHHTFIRHFFALLCHKHILLCLEPIIQHHTIHTIIHIHIIPHTFFLSHAKFPLTLIRTHSKWHFHSCSITITRNCFVYKFSPAYTHHTSPISLRLYSYTHALISAHIQISLLTFHSYHMHSLFYHYLMPMFLNHSSICQAHVYHVISWTCI